MKADGAGAAPPWGGWVVSAAFLGLTLLAVHAARDAWDSFVHYRPPFRFADGGAAGGPRVTHRVVLVLVDGLRLDRSRGLKALDVLRARGADFDCTTSSPTYSRPGRANLATGAWPDIHGATTNRHRETIAVDSLFRAARRAGESVAVAGSPMWPGLFGPDLEGALVLPTPVEEEPGAFARLEPRMQNFERDALRSLVEREARLSVLDLDIPDFAAHEYGARSPQYARAALEADRTIGLLADAVNLWTTTVIVTADHGHVDAGGHGGVEPEVLQVPLVMAGRGIREGYAGVARQIDVAPTIAALLGLPVPAASEGRPLAEAFDTKDSNLRGLGERALEQKAAFARQYLSALGRGDDLPAVDAGDGSLRASLSAMTALDEAVARTRESRIDEERRGRLARVVLWLAVPLAAALWALRRAGAMGAAVAIASAFASEGLFRLLAHLRGLEPSISRINHDGDLEPYFIGVTVVGGLAALCCVAAALVVGSRRSARPEEGTLLLAFAAAVGAACVPAAVVALAHWRQGLDLVWRIGDVQERFAADVALARLAATGVVGTVAPVLAWFARLARRPARATP